MNRSTIALTLMSSLLLAACAAPTHPDDTRTAQAKPECEREYMTGSMIAKKDCTPPMSAEDRQRMQDALAAQIHPTASSPPSAGGK